MRLLIAHWRYRRAHRRYWAYQRTPSAWSFPIASALNRKLAQAEREYVALMLR